MISLTLTNVKKFMSQLLMTETFDRFSFIEGEIVTFNTFKLDGYLQKDFFDAPDGYESESSPTPLEEYSRWGDIREFCFSLIKGKRASRWWTVPTVPFSPKPRRRTVRTATTPCLW